MPPDKFSSRHALCGSNNIMRPDRWICAYNKRGMDMRHALIGWVCSLFFLAFTMPVQAVEKGTADEAAALVKKAVELIKAKGKDAALAEFNNPKGRFVD